MIYSWRNCWLIVRSRWGQDFLTNSLPNGKPYGAKLRRESGVWTVRVMMTRPYTFGIFQFDRRRLARMFLKSFAKKERRRWKRAKRAVARPAHV